MKQTEYLLISNIECTRSVAEAMVLFDLRPAADAGNNDFSSLASHQIGVKVACRPDGPLWLIVLEIIYNEQERHRITRSAQQALHADDMHGSEKNRVIRLLIWETMKSITGQDPSPWGILRGVRPVKIVHRLLDKGFSPSAIPTQLTTHYGVSAVKAALVTAIAVKQRPFLALPGHSNRTVSLYIAIPYCPTRCLYCSFPANPLPPDPMQLAAFLKALYRDLADTREALRRHQLQVQTIYVGGGTPTSLNDQDFSQLIETIANWFVSSTVREFTVEAGRPDSITTGKITAMIRHGVTRVSINPQTMQDRTLRLIGRNHTVQDVTSVFHQIRQNQAISINMDIIAGLPGETEQDMIDTMEKISSLRPDNLTVHTLALKQGSELKANSSLQLLPDRQTTVSMVEIAAAYAAEMRLEPYYLYRQKYMTGNLENVGYALPAKECLYNIQIMEERQTIIGSGPAAGSKVVDCRTMKLQSSYNPKEVTRYISHLPVYLQTRNRVLDELYEDRTNLPL